MRSNKRNLEQNNSNTRGFPDPPLLTPDEGPSLETSIFPLMALSFQVVREPLPFE